MTDIVALTLNPSIDISTSVDRVAPIGKLRCSAPRFDPGGGGVNVARVASRCGSAPTSSCSTRQEERRGSSFAT